MDIISLKNLSDEEKKMTAINYLDYLKVKNKKEIIEFLNKIHDNNILFLTNDCYIAGHVTSVDANNFMPEFKIKGIKFSESFLSYNKEINVRLTKVPSYVILNDYLFENKYKDFYFSFKNILLDETKQYSNIDFTKKVSFKSSIDTTIDDKDYLNVNDSFLRFGRMKNKTMNDIIQILQEKHEKKVQEAENVKQFLIDITNKVLVAKVFLGYKLFIPLTTDIENNTSKGILFEFIDDGKYISIKTYDNILKYIDGVNFHLIENDEYNETLMYKLLKLKTQYKKLINSTKFLLE